MEHFPLEIPTTDDVNSLSSVGSAMLGSARLVVASGVGFERVRWDARNSNSRFLFKC